MPVTNILLPVMEMPTIFWVFAFIPYFAVKELACLKMNYEDLMISKLQLNFELMEQNFVIGWGKPPSV